MNEILGRALDLHSCGYFHSPSATRVIYVSGSEKETCLWLPKATLWAAPCGNTQKALRPRRPKSCASTHGIAVLSLHELGALTTAHLFLSLFPPWTNESGKGYSGMLTPLRRMPL